MKKKLYIVSFGDSDKYRFLYEVPEDATALSKPSPFAALEKELSDYLADKFPGESFTFLTSAKATEVDTDHEAQYESYPMLDAEAVKQIKEVISKEAQDYLANKELNDNAPFSNIGDGITT